ncbi:16S rRNA processing protein RimM [uncultured Porphyromonas sp.]|uniref:ribosome maturation factor RimM n=1 Tax=uncultured Porphyromonas sp. TaxID=159274 RepID=UPI00262A6D66|nr:16S rRNA processing protein RimM [uncultured Porphyromonas sp.]
MLDKADFEPIGRLGRTHGIGGELSTKLSVDLSVLWEEDERLFLFLEEQELLIPYRVRSLRAKTDELDLIAFVDVMTKEAAEALVGRELWLERAYLDHDEAEAVLGLEHYVGFELYEADSGDYLGRITDVDDSTLNVLMRVETPLGDELVLPIAEELISEVKLAEHQLYLQVPQGLLDL